MIVGYITLSFVKGYFINYKRSAVDTSRAARMSQEADARCLRLYANNCLVNLSIIDVARNWSWEGRAEGRTSRPKAESRGGVLGRVGAASSLPSS